METLIAVFSGAAFLALIVYLWNSDPAPKQATDEAAKEESPSPGRVHDSKEGALASSTLESEHVAQQSLSERCGLREIGFIDL